MSGPASEMVTEPMILAGRRAFLRGGAAVMNSDAFVRIYTAMHAARPPDPEADLIEALEWIEAFAQIRAADDSKIFARVNRGALRTIAERAGAALSRTQSGDER